LPPPYIEMRDGFAMDDSGALLDIGPDDGPLHFLGKSASRRVAESLDYGARGVPYRLSDADVYAIVD
jgi:hypothetical protein